MNEVTLPTIPAYHVGFAKAVADAADKYGIDRFTMTYRPGFEQRMQGHAFHGDMKISYAAVDGRGRPDRRVEISLESTYTIYNIGDDDKSA